MAAYFPFSYFGSIAYFQHLCAHKHCTLEIQDTYQKQSLRNRLTYISANGMHQLSIPVIRTQGSKSKSIEIEIDYSQRWQQNHWRTLESAYAASPYFEHYERDIHALLFSGEKSLVQFSKNTLAFIIHALELPIELFWSEEFLLANNEDLDFRGQKQMTELIFPVSYTPLFKAPVGFEGEVSILDALFNWGPMARVFLVPVEK